MKLPNGTYATTPRGDAAPRPTALHYAIADRAGTIVEDELATTDDAYDVGSGIADPAGLVIVAVLDDGTTRTVGPVDPFEGLS